MATGGGTKKSCCKCDKGGATFTCDGCRLSFCLKHASDHRQELAQQMDNIGQEHDILKRNIDEQSINQVLSAEIDRWEEKSIEKIRSSANKARADLKRLTDESKTRLTILMNKLSAELRSNRKDDDYKEEDLDRWINQLKELRKELEKPSEIEIVDDKPSSFYLIQIKKASVVGNEIVDLLQQSVVHSVEKFNEIVGPVVLSEDGCSLTSVSKWNSSDKFSSSCGIRYYSSGIHCLRFRINTPNSSAIFLGIIKSSETMSNRSAALNSAYGCWSRGRCVRKGVYAEEYERIKTLPIDEVTITLDCHARTITYLHERTDKYSIVKVDEENCPLPWKLVVTLWCPNDKIEILN